MGLFRILFWIALVAVAIWLWRRLKRPAPAKPGSGPAAMVRCASCGIHVPQDHAHKAGDRWYCSQLHLEQDKANGGH
ncbi:hypothetical protein HKW98_15135 [Stutzerimonas urumqiensis]|uniref:PP0621 family protein n=1 Tax=Stutzerimonas urumqiensis TaxID=638269 RepID=UPI003BAD0847